jgi:hypothetical protein
MVIETCSSSSISFVGSLESANSMGWWKAIDNTHLYNLQLLQPFLDKLLYSSLVGFVLMFTKSILCSSPSIFPEAVVGKLGRLP